MGSSQPTRAGSVRSDDRFDDNRDDSGFLRDTNYRIKIVLNCLFRGYARFWQCRGQGFESP